MVYDPYMHELGNGMKELNCKILLPHPSLNRHIYRYFVLSNENKLPLENEWYILPDNCSHLIFYLFDKGNTVEPKWHLIGPRSKHKIINRENRLFTFACSFRAGGLAPFIQMPMSELTDQFTLATALFKSSEQAFEWLSLSALSGDVKRFIEQLEVFLFQALRAPLQINPAVEGLYQHYLGTLHHADLKDVSKRLGYSERHFRSLVKKYIGHSPKRVEQIERFSLSLRKSIKTLDWADIAYSSGYYDQSHMIGDYQKLVGKSPDRLFQ